MKVGTGKGPKASMMQALKMGKKASKGKKGAPRMISMKKMTSNC